MIAHVPPSPALRGAPPRLRQAAIALIVVATVTGLLGAAFMPYLLVEHPLLLIGLSPGPANLVLAAGSLDPWSFVLVGLPRRILGFVASYAFGALYGYAAVSWVAGKSARLQRWTRLAERVVGRYGAWVVLLLPFQLLAVVAGAMGTRFRSFLLAITASLAIHVPLTYWFGDLAAVWTDRLLAFLRAHLLESTLVAVALVALSQIVGRRRRAEPPAPESEPAPAEE